MNQFDYCAYTSKSESKIAILSLYVDNILLIGNDMDIIKKIKLYLKLRFEMKDMDENSYILEIKITKD